MTNIPTDEPGYPRLAAGPDAYGNDTVWLEEHLGDSRPQPLLDVSDPPGGTAVMDRVLWDRIVAGMPCSVEEYEKATASIGGESR